MIQMCVYNSILAGRLGDCWLAPGRLLAGPWETAGWSLGGLLAPGKLLLLAALGGCWLGCADSLILLIFTAAAWWWKLKADADFSGALTGLELKADADFSVALKFDWKRQSQHHQINPPKMAQFFSKFLA